MYKRQGLSLYRFTASDGVSLLHVTLFNNKYAAAKIKKGEDYLFFGTVTGGFRRAEMASPLIEPAEGGARIRPIYPQTEGLTSRVIETVVATVIFQLSTLMGAVAVACFPRHRFGDTSPVLYAD